jgi:site-specific recombinases, DNA invertase pin homologs
VIDEVIIENAFVEMFALLAKNFDDVLESVLSSIEETLSKDDSTEKLKRIEKDISSLEKKRKKLTDMYLDDKLTKEAYDDKYSELSKKLDK